MMRCDVTRVPILGMRKEDYLRLLLFENSDNIVFFQRLEPLTRQDIPPKVVTGILELGRATSLTLYITAKGNRNIDNLHFRFAHQAQREQPGNTLVVRVRGKDEHLVL